LPPFGKIEPSFSEDDKDEEITLAVNHQDESKPFGSTSVETPVDDIQQPVHIDNDEVAGFAASDEPQKIRVNKKRAFGLLLFVAIIVSAVIFAGDLYNLTSSTLKEKIVEVEDIAKIKTPPSSKFIDDEEQQNSYLKENSEAKQANVSVFDFDINNCLQQYSDEQCTDMYEKNLLIDEKKQ